MMIDPLYLGPVDNERLRWMFLHGCVGKMVFKSKGTALRQLDYMERKGRANQRHAAREMTPYECLFCGGWHVGHSKGSSKNV